MISFFYNRCWRFTLYFILSYAAISYSGTAAQTYSDQAIKTIYSAPQLQALHGLDKRIEYISALFINTPYSLGPLGEGNKALFDQSPLYRLDQFDCQTYVDTVLALALASNLTEFKTCINNIRYKQGKIRFINRNHFTCLDWNQNNAQQGYIKDITPSIKDEHGHSIALTAQALIDKPSWYQHLSSTSIKLPQIDTQEKAARLGKLQAMGKALPKRFSTISYLPLNRLFDNNQQANQFIFSQIPNGAIIEIVRPNWDLKNQIGTALNVSHLGFAFWKNHQLIFRNASSLVNKVVDKPLIDYLKNTLDSPTIKGINVHIVLDNECFKP